MYLLSFTMYYIIFNLLNYSPTYGESEGIGIGIEVTGVPVTKQKKNLIKE